MQAQATNTSCGFFLLGNIAKVSGEQMVVSAGKGVFAVIPPSSGQLWVSGQGRATDLRVGDDVRVSTTSTGRTVVATMVNVYRKETKEAGGAESEAGEEKSKKTKKSKAKAKE